MSNIKVYFMLIWFQIDDALNCWRQLMRMSFAESRKASIEYKMIYAWQIDVFYEAISEDYNKHIITGAYKTDED